jgi:hypothetical protein
MVECGGAALAADAIVFVATQYVADLIDALVVVGNSACHGGLVFSELNRDGH